jgi:membrane protein DedA with SNARE-associated domain
VSHFVETYGVWLVAAMLAIESMGIPVPGETTLIAAAILAGTNPTQNIWFVIAAGIIGAAGGSLVGFWLGRSLGYRLVIRYGSSIGLTEARLKIGQFLFRRYGLAIVLVARFFPMLRRSIMGILAGINQMQTMSFLVGTTAGAIAWVMLITLSAYYLGEELRHQTRGATILIGIAAVLVVAIIAFVVARYEARLAARAERELPGPLPRP